MSFIEGVVASLCNLCQSTGSNNEGMQRWIGTFDVNGIIPDDSIDDIQDMCLSCLLSHDPSKHSLAAHSIGREELKEDMRIIFKAVKK